MVAARVRRDFGPAAGSAPPHSGALSRNSSGALSSTRGNATPTSLSATRGAHTAIARSSISGAHSMSGPCNGRRDTTRSTSMRSMAATSRSDISHTSRPLCAVRSASSRGSSQPCAKSGGQASSSDCLLR